MNRAIGRLNVRRLTSIMLLVSGIALAYGSDAFGWRGRGGGFHGFGGGGGFHGFGGDGFGGGTMGHSSSGD
jgi:hypothetical protein